MMSIISISHVHIAHEKITAWKVRRWLPSSVSFSSPFCYLYVILHIGIFMGPRPPSDLGMLTQAKWDHKESQLAASTAVFNASNSSTRSPNAIISVGHTYLIILNNWTLSAPSIIKVTIRKLVSHEEEHYLILECYPLFTSYNIL